MILVYNLMKKLNSHLYMSVLRVTRATTAVLLFTILLSGCASTQESMSRGSPALIWNGTEDVRFLMAYQNETPESHILNGMIRDSRGRRHQLFNSHIDAQFIGENGLVLREVCAQLRPLPRPRVIYRLARFSVSIEKTTEQVDQYRLFYHENKSHC